MKLQILSVLLGGAILGVRARNELHKIQNTAKM